MNGSKVAGRVKVSADGTGVVSHAGVAILRELADLTGLSAQVSDVLADTYRGPWRHDPGRVFTDIAAAVADGADCVSGIGSLADRRDQHAPVASVTTAWRLLARRVDAGRLPALQAARGAARAKAWAAGAAPAHVDGWLQIDIDGTITIDHSDGKENAAATWKRTFGFHPLLAFLDRPDIAGGEALPGYYGRATPARTPPPTTSPCSTKPWPRSRRATAPTPTSPAVPIMLKAGGC